MKPKVAKRITTPSDSSPPPPPRPQLHSTTFPQTIIFKQTEIGSKEASTCTRLACARLGAIRTDNYFQRITEYWY